MIPKCRGCQEELAEAFYQASRGLYLATTKKRTGIGERKHFIIIMVDDKGKIIIS